MTSVQLQDLNYHSSIRDFIGGGNKQEGQGEIYLGQNFPDPFVSITIIPIIVPEACFAVLDVFDLSGLKMMTLMETWLIGGETTVALDRSALVPGTYRYQLTVQSYTGTKILNRELRVQ